MSPPQRPKDRLSSEKIPVLLLFLYNMLRIWFMKSGVFFYAALVLNTFRL